MDRFLNDFVLYTSAAGLVLFGAWAWWSWFRLERSSVSSWRRTASVISLSLVSSRVCLGAFALAYLYLQPESGPGLPQPTITAMQTGASLGRRGTSLLVLRRVIDALGSDPIRRRITLVFLSDRALTLDTYGAKVRR
jgi:hypothetical protein